MSDRKNHRHRISGPRDYLYALTDENELEGVIRKDRLLGSEARIAAMGNVSEALRTHLRVLFFDDKKREVSMLRSRGLMGIEGTEAQIAKMFEEFATKRTTESLELEYDYLVGMTSLISATRHAINEVSEMAAEKKIGELINILETVIKITSRYTKLFMGGKKVTKGKGGEFNLLTPEASVEMIELTVISNIKSTVRLATELNEIVKGSKPKSDELVVSPEQAKREWLAIAIEKLIKQLKVLLAYFDKDSKPTLSPIIPEAQEISVEEKIIDKTLISLKALSTQLRIILANLEQRPGLFVFHHFELLKSFADGPEQTLGGLLKEFDDKKAAK